MSKKFFGSLTLFLVLLALFYNSLHGAIPAQERAALIALFNATQGDSWFNNTGWKTPPLHTDGFATPGTEGNWRGIEIQDDHVTVINLSFNNLQGPIPPELENLSYLQNLSLSGYTQRPIHSNHLSGNIPPNLGNLIHLQTLDLSSNELTGNIPPELGNLANLVTLDLSWNPFSGTIPQELGNLANLKKLLLSQTPLTGNIPSSFGNLLNLENLSLYYNQLSGAIPSSLGNLVNLKNLFLSFNPLSGSIPDSFGNLSNLSFLLLEQTQISGSIPSSFGNLHSLREAHLSNNQLSGSIPASFGNLANLEFLYLDHNQISGSIPAEFGNLGKLSIADLSNNQLSGSIPLELKNLQNLRDLKLDHNQLSGSIPIEFGNLGNLSNADLSYNQLNGSIPPELENLHNLKYLKLGHNQFSGSIPIEFGNLGNLSNADLSYNQLNGSIPPELENLHNLRDLKLDHNQLSGCIPPEIGNMSKLESLVLSYNQLSGSIPTELVNLNDLDDLFLDHNQLSGSIPPELGNMYNLKSLVLGNNQFSGSIPTELGKLYDLNELFLDNNQLSGIIPPELGNMYYLSSLFLDHNQLSGSISFNFGSLKHLRNLNLSYNQLTGNIPSELGNIKYLSRLQLQENQLSGTIPSSLGNPKFRVLTLDHNYLSGEIPSSFINLNPYEAFDIGYNCLHASDPTLRAWLDSHDPDWEVYQNRCGISGVPFIDVNRTKLNFSAVASAETIVTGPQEIWIANGGGGTLAWTISSDASWLSGTPISGTGRGRIFVSVDPSGLTEGTYTGNIIITVPGASNSPRNITIILKVKSQFEDIRPFGDFSTPHDASFVYGSVPVTGWALDDIGIQDVKIYGEYENSMFYIGEAVFVEGARPDIEAIYSDYPDNYKAGWGYMLLTNYLPNGGNGIYKLQATATDKNGKSTILGVITIDVHNADVLKPFGNIDTPEQGGVISGKNFVNFGWALTPQPNYIPANGSTIDLWIDGVKLGHPKYNNYRSDIAAIFPGYANSNGAVGYFYLDTTAYENGIHTIAWAVKDSHGNSSGIGSRYFSIQNSENLKIQYPDQYIANSHDIIKTISTLFSEPIGFKRGFSADSEFEELLPDENGLSRLTIKELERVEIKLGKNYSGIQGYLMSNNEFKKLPIGSTLDKKSGTFSWLPGPGFLGKYSLVFILTADSNGQSFKKNIEIEIEPKFN